MNSRPRPGQDPGESAPQEASGADDQGHRHGEILHAPRGEGGFGYDPLFLIPELGKTGAELALEEKNRISHRGKALAALLRRLAVETR
jgi:XTP/dITP diphosphohydrolase